MSSSDAPEGPNRQGLQGSESGEAAGGRANRPSRTALGEALRANLRRRKDQAKIRREAATEDEKQGDKP